VYESASILASVAVSMSSLVLTTVSYGMVPEDDPAQEEDYPRPDALVEKRLVFIAGYVLTLVCGFIAYIAPLWSAATEHILEVCGQYSNEHNTEWKKGAIQSIRSGIAFYVGMSVGALVAIVIGLVCWHRLRSRNHRPDTKKPLVIAIGMSSGLLIAIAVMEFVDLLNMRQTMGVLWDQQNGPDSWTIGQIGAIFSWAPLLADIFCLGAQRLVEIIHPR